MLARSVQKLSCSMLHSVRAVHTEAKLAELGHVLPPVGKAQANYVMCTRVGNLIYTAGHLPQDLDGNIRVGKVGKDVTTEEAYEAAQLVALNLLSTLQRMCVWLVLVHLRCAG